MDHRPRLLLAVALLVFAASGASCPKWLSAYKISVPGPQALTASPTLDDVVRVVNANAEKVQSLYAADATVAVPMAPKLRATLAFDRPRRFRLRAETGLTGAEFDAGSNDEQFWYWVRRQNPPAVFVCRHDQFRQSVVRQMMPIEPEWVIDALGIGGFDPAHEHTGPTPVRGGRLEVRSRVPRPEGDYTRVTLVDAVRGWIVEQHLYNERGELLVSATMSQHARDSATGAYLPRHVEVRAAQGQFAITLDVRQWSVNQLTGDPSQYFTLPEVPGATLVDLGDPRLLAPPAAAPTAALPADPASAGVYR